jgi:hypothetical protein
MRKRGNPDHCCCPGPPPCDHGPYFTALATIACCRLPAPMTVTIRHGTTTIATCTADDDGHGAYCIVTLSGVAPGDAISWTLDVPGLPSHSGTATVPECGGATGASVSYQLTELYPTLTLTDPAGNEITLGGSGSAYTGSHTYTGLCPDAYGGPYGDGDSMTIDYAFNASPCSNFGGFNTGCTLRASFDGPTICGDVEPETLCFDGALPAVRGAGVSGLVASKSCPPMLAHWTVSGVPYFRTGSVFVPFWGINAPPSPPPLLYTLTP